MRRSIVLLVLLAGGLACALQRPRFAVGGRVPGTWCVPDTGLMERILFDAVATMTSSRGEIPTDVRKRVGVPAVERAEVTRVTDEVQCERASRAMAAQFFDPDAAGGPHLEPVHLFRTGPRWVVVPRDSWAGEWAPAVHFDSTFRKLGVHSL